jgi:hypothetical protein
MVDIKDEANIANLVSVAALPGPLPRSPTVENMTLPKEARSIKIACTSSHVS